MTYVPPRRSDGTIQTRRPQQPWPKDRPFRILSIDGGGICGILPASVLAELEQRFLDGQTVARYFDMIAGTSTGGIIALGLAHGLTASEIRNFYTERGDKIFPPTSVFGQWWRWLRQKHRYIYERGPLEVELLRIFGDSVLGQAKIRLCIPAFEDRVERMVKVALSTAAAPTFFEALPNNGYVMVDGGLWANNPIMNALVDALACYDLDRGQVQILSLGCGETRFTVDAAKTQGGEIQWRKVFLAATRAQSLNALGQAYLLVGKDRVMRIDAPETSNPIAMDDFLRAKDELPAMARSLVEGAGREVNRVFFNDAVEPFVACPLG